MRSVIYFNTDITRISTIQQDFLIRFSVYSKFVQEVSKDDSKVMTLLLGGVSGEATMPNLRILSLPHNLIKQFVSLACILRKTKGCKTLVLGDNDISLVLGWLASRFSRDTKLQISLHSSLDQIMHPKFVVDYFRKLLFLFSLHLVHSIRMVSLGDIISFNNLFPNHVPEIVYAPVPLQIPERKIDHSIRKRLAFVGRLHEERGIFQLVEIIKLLDFENNQDIELIIVGDGPKEKWLHDELAEITNLKVKFMGKLAHREVQELLPSVQVLLSCAPLESYGMALREALLNGCMVVARENKTTTELRLTFPQHFKTYKGIRDAVDKILFFFSSPRQVTDVENYQSLVSEQQQINLLRLAKSWLE